MIGGVVGLTHARVVVEQRRRAPPANRLVDMLCLGDDRNVKAVIVAGRQELY